MVLFQCADLSPLHNHRLFQVSLSALSLMCVSDTRVLGPLNVLLLLADLIKLFPLRLYNSLTNARPEPALMDTGMLAYLEKEYIKSLTPPL